MTIDEKRELVANVAAMYAAEQQKKQNRKPLKNIESNVSTRATDRNTTPILVAKKGRKPYPRDENGNIIRTEKK